MNVFTQNVRHEVNLSVECSWFEILERVRFSFSEIGFLTKINMFNLHDYLPIERIV